MTDYFPLTIAFEEAFFDRIMERKRLKNNVLKNTHTLVTSPRRYGKTSLVLKVISEVDILGSQIDLMIASDPENMKGIILDGIGKAASQMASGSAKIIQLIRQLFQPFNTLETLELGQLKIRFHPYADKAPELIVLDALERLESLAQKLDKRVVLFFDEYQHVLTIDRAIDFEAALRSFAQNAKLVVCVFSGSNRHLLQKMFSDASRPFYNMCDHILLERISADDHTQHLQKLSLEQWGESLSSCVIDTILTLTQCHTYYVNALCRRIWQSENLPNIDLIMQEWQELAQEKRHEISNDFQKLSPIQKTVLIELARAPFSKPTSKDVLKRLDASLSGITHSIEVLIEQDYIFRDAEKFYHVLNPLLAYTLRQEALKLQ